MAQHHEWAFYELMWKAHTQHADYPIPWWVQMSFRHWTDDFDRGLFASKESAFASNALYRYWNMVGVKDHKQECLVGQCGEVEPVYDKYSLSFFLFDPTTKQLWFPQRPETGPLRQTVKDRFLPIIQTTWRCHAAGVEVCQTVSAHAVGSDKRSMCLADFQIKCDGDTPGRKLWFCLAVLPFGPTGFQRHDRAGRGQIERLLSQIEYRGRRDSLRLNWNSLGPVFGTPPHHFGLYGNASEWHDAAEHYITNSPFGDLRNRGALNGAEVAVDNIAGMCTGAFAWEFYSDDGNGNSATHSFDVRFPVDDYLSASDFTALCTADAPSLQEANESFWTQKLTQEGLQATLTHRIHHLFDLYKLCRANLLILSDGGQIHPGPTIYDSFWIRDSAIEGIAAALAGDTNLARRQYKHHYPGKFNLHYGRIGPCSAYGFFGGEHEKNDLEWDSNGLVLWALGKFDRIDGGGNFGGSMFHPYVIKASRWLMNNRTEHGLLHSGWSAEHVGDKDKPHYWDDFWGVAGLYEAARLAERIGARETQEIWDIYESLRSATAESILWVLAEQRRRGEWRTYIPTGPADVLACDSTMVGTLAYFHPCRLYMGKKLGEEVDKAARLTLDTMWHCFVRHGGFYHASAWECFGPYLTLQLAHAFLLIGDTERMDACLNWAVANAAFPKVSRISGEEYDVVQGAWNEQHCSPVESKGVNYPPKGWWYMGDIPHGWACAEYIMLIRDILFFEAEEDSNAKKIFIAPGILPHWQSGNDTITVKQAPTIFGGTFGYTLVHDPAAQTVRITLKASSALQHVSYAYRCAFGTRINQAVLSGGRGSDAIVDGIHIYLPPGTHEVSINYA